MAWALLAPAIVGGRQDPAPRFKSGVHVVEVDAVAFDRAGRPVRGLTASDFSVSENGEPRRIVAVTEVSIPVGSPSAAASSRLDVTDNQEPEGRLLILFIDDATIPPDAAMVQAAKDIAWGAVERMGPADVMSVVFTGHTRHAQDFTRDRERLRRAIERTTVGFDTSGRGSGRLWNASILTLLNIAESLRDVPRHRKAILYVSIGVPGGAAGFLKEWRALTQSAPGSTTPVYAFDPSGLGGLEALNAGHPSSRVGGHPDGFREFLRDIAANTGGRAAVQTNGYDKWLDQLFEDTASYYLIGYETPQPPDDGRFRRLDVRTTRPGTTAKARPFFFSPKTSSRSSSRQGASSSAFGALASAIPITNLPMQAMAASFAGPSRADAIVAIVIAFRHPAAGTRQHRIDLVTAAFEHDGRQRAMQHQEASIRLTEPVAASVVYEVTTSVRLKPGRYRLRLGARSRTLQQSGSVFLDVDVPDFSRERLSLSGLVLATSAAPKQAVIPGMRSTLPIAVSTLREFSGSDTVTGFLRVYQGDSEEVRRVEASVSVVDRRGTSIEASKRTILREQFSRRFADLSFPVPVERLPSGRYTLRVEVSAPGVPVASRELTFVVR
ncbi:MAG: VWA domain-containing protein [Acidobacteriota bacterium]|nr:VWA domain-containing protein [Acidobacteriota bacterium]